MKTAPVFLAACAAVFGALARAQFTPAVDPPVALPEFFVAGERIGSVTLNVPRGDLRPPEPNPGQELLAIPGVYGHARAADALEPSIRGLSLDRVATTLNGLPLVNASPERTNSPIVILGPVALADITVAKALPSVTLGPATSGGRISLTSTLASPADDAIPEGSGGFVNTTYNGARQGVINRARLFSRHGPWLASASAFHNDLGDYTSPTGRRVAARLDETGATAALGWHSPSQQASLEILQRRLRHQETLALPLDGKNTDSLVLTFNHQIRLGRAALQQIDWRAGYATTDPYITSEDRTAPTLTYALARARSFGAGVDSLWHTSAHTTLAAGVDYARQYRRAVRTTPTGKDYIWPGAIYGDAGVFAEWHAPLPADGKLRVGARLDDVQSQARDADQPALGRPIRQQFSTYNGPDAAITDRRNTAGALNALARWKRRPNVDLFAGVGLSVQPAPVMERYRAFLNALGGDGRGGNAVELGNPALRSERKWAVETGVTWKQPWADFEATAYYYRIDDFILRTRIGTTHPPTAAMTVFGYRNVDADFAGAELGATLKPHSGLTLPLTFAIADGRERQGGNGLAELPPWEATAAVRHRMSSHRLPVSSEFGVRIVGRKDNPAPLENPLFVNTGGFAVSHLRLGVPLGRRFQLEAGVENLFDKNYSEYLTPPVGPFKPATGNLLPGERVPNPRRSGWFSFTWKL